MVAFPFLNLFFDIFLLFPQFHLKLWKTHCKIHKISKKIKRAMGFAHFTLSSLYFPLT